MIKNKAFLAAAIITLTIGLTGLALTCFLTDRTNISTSLKSFSSLGEQIYNTGRGEDGKLISFNGGPHWMNMHGGSCVSCHGKKGKGDIRIDMTEEVAPAITWNALIEGEHEKKEEKHEDEHLPYDEKTIKKAIIEGKNPAGESLESAMPRWKMSDKEVEAVIEFLKTLD